MKRVTMNRVCSALKNTALDLSVAFILWMLFFPDRKLHTIIVLELMVISAHHLVDLFRRRNK